MLTGPAISTIIFGMPDWGAGATATMLCLLATVATVAVATILISRAMHWKGKKGFHWWLGAVAASIGTGFLVAFVSCGVGIDVDHLWRLPIIGLLAIAAVILFCWATKDSQ
jgi:hypothetical protein